MEEEDKSIEALQEILQRAVSDDGLLKAKKKNDDDDEEKEEYDEKFMKKMKSYMKKNKKYMKDDEEMKGMKKALETEQADLSGEIQEAEATIVDGTKMFQKFVDFAEGMMKAMSSVGQRLESLEDQLEFNGELAKASGSVLVKTASLMDNVSNTPNPLKGVAASFVPQATAQQPEAGNANLQKAAFLEKAGKLGISGIKNLLQKAMLSGNMEAGKVLTTIECCHGNLNLVPNSGMRVIANLLPTQ